jgi:hypothetical protein
MESDSSAKSLLSLFSTSNLKTFDPETTRNFYKSTPPPTASTDDASPEHDRPRKKRRPSGNVEWTCAEIRALETYKSLAKGEEIDSGLREVLLPNRTDVAVQRQLARVENTIRERRGSKLKELQKEENILFVEEEKVKMVEMEKDRKRRREGMDDLLGLDDDRTQAGGLENKEAWAGNEDAKVSLDQALGLFEESEEQRRRREFDAALGLREDGER